MKGYIRSNHRVIYLTGKTEIQVGFVDGNFRLRLATIEETQSTYRALLSYFRKHRPISSEHHTERAIINAIDQPLGMGQLKRQNL